MDELLVNLSNPWLLDGLDAKWDDPEERVIRFPVTSDEVRWLSQGLRKARQIQGALRDKDLGVEHSDMDVWAPLPESVREKFAQAGLPDPDSLVITTTGRLGRVHKGKIVKKWPETYLPDMPSLKSSQIISMRENEYFLDGIHTYLQGAGVTKEEVRGFLAMLWEQARPDDTAFMGLPREQRVEWSMRWLEKLVKDGRISRALAFRVLEAIS